MSPSIKDQLSPETLDAAMYPTRGSIESVRTQAIRELFQAAARQLSSLWANGLGRRRYNAPIAPQATAAAC